MNTMRAVLFIFCIIATSSCTDDWRLERKEDRLYGVWTIEEAWFRENGNLFRESVRREFVGDRVEFYGDYEGVYSDFSTRQYYPSIWRLDLIRERRFDRDGTRNDDVEFYLLIDFFNKFGEVEFSWDAEVNCLTYDKLNIRVNDSTGVFTFKLRRA